MKYSAYIRGIVYGIYINIYYNENDGGDDEEGVLRKKE